MRQESKKTFTEGKGHLTGGAKSSTGRGMANAGGKFSTTLNVKKRPHWLRLHLSMI